MKIGTLLILLMLSAVVLPVSAQDKGGPDVVVEREEMLSGPALAPPDDADTFVFISSEMEFGEKLVKGSPYSADAVTERTQELSDGTHISQKNTCSIYRDGEGRVRRDRELGAIGPWSASHGMPAHTSFIHDPVKGVDYILDAETKTARKLKLPENGKGAIAFAPHPQGHDEDETFVAPVPPPHGAGEKQVFMFHDELKNAKKESLGKQMIEGISVEGTRTTSTIEAGKIGNDRAIQIVSEKWYSPELQTYVMTRHSDPRFGEVIYRLTNIRMGEPDRSLFEPPADYKIVDAPMPDKIVIKKRLSKED